MSEELKKRCLAMAAAGNLTPRALWESAADPSDPLHELFDWDDEDAARKWRDDQARGYIASIKIKVVFEDRELPVPVYVRDVSKPDNEQGYVATLSLRDDPAKAAETVRRETGYATAALTRARGVAAALSCSAEIDRLIHDLIRLRDTVS